MVVGIDHDGEASVLLVIGKQRNKWRDLIRMETQDEYDYLIECITSPAYPLEMAMVP